MKFRMFISVALITATINTIVFANGDIYDLLAETPNDAGLIFLCADVPGIRENLKELGLEEELLEALQLIHEDLAELYKALSGRLLISYEFPDYDISIVADIDLDSELVNNLNHANKILDAMVEAEGEGVYRLLLRDNQLIVYMGYKDGTLRISQRRDMVVEPQAIPGPKYSDSLHFIKFSRLFDMESGLIWLVSEDHIRRSTNLLQFPPIPLDVGRYYTDEFVEEYFSLITRFHMALQGLDRFIFGGSRMEIGNDISIESLVIYREFQPPADIDTTLILPRWERPPIHVLSGRSELIKGIMPALRRGFAAAHHEILDEFDEEMAEVNEELGFYFERDFIGNLTGDWSLSTWGRLQWAFKFQVDDPDSFLNHVRAIAKLSNELWEPEENAPDGTVAINSRVYTIPVRLVVVGNEVMLSAGELPEQKEPAADIALPNNQEIEVIRARYRLNMSPLFRVPLEGSINEMWTSAFEDIAENAEVKLTVRDSEGYRRSKVVVENLDRDDLRKIFGRVEQILDVLM